MSIVVIDRPPLDTEKLAAEERRKVRQLLEEIKVTIEEMLARIE